MFDRAKECDENLLHLLDSISKMLTSIQFGEDHFKHDSSKQVIKEMLELIKTVADYVSSYVNLHFISMNHSCFSV